MTGCAVLITWIGHVVTRRLYGDTGALPAERTSAIVALEAEREYNRPAKKPRVHGAVGKVTALAAVHTHRRMFKNKWPAFL